MMVDHKTAFGLIGTFGALFIALLYASSQYNAPKGLATRIWHDNILQELFDAQEPVILWNSPTSEWATSTWTLESVLSNIQVPRLKVHSASPPVFKHHDQHLELGSKFPPPFNVSLLKPQDLKALFLQANGTSVGFYINGEVKQLSPRLAEDVYPVHPFVLPSAAKSTFVKLWLSSPNVVANLHYDATHNIFHQVHGIKKFILFPPSSFENLYVYSRLHPSHRQSQIDISQPLTMILEQFPRYQDALSSRIEVTLQPGDTMYLPPFWFHAVVVFDEPSVSVNVWSDSNELDVLNMALQDPVPYLAKFEAKQLVVDLSSHLYALQLYVDMLLKELIPDPKKWIQAHLEAQVKYIPVDSFECGQVSDPAIKRTMKKNMKPFVKSVVQKSFSSSDISTAILATSFIEALLGHYIDPMHVGSFLFHCILEN